jgi:hypothetical protein
MQINLVLFFLVLFTVISLGAAVRNERRTINRRSPSEYDSYDSYDSYGGDYKLSKYNKVII